MLKNCGLKSIKAPKTLRHPPSPPTPPPPVFDTLVEWVCLYYNCKLTNVKAAKIDLQKDLPSKNHRQELQKYLYRHLVFHQELNQYA